MKKIILAVLMLSVFPNTMTPHRRPTSTIPTPKPFKRVSEREVTCLANNIFYEASEESYEGKLAVATVTMNRVKSRYFPKSVCAVVYQKNSKGCQFSWTCSGRTKYNHSKFLEAKRIAYDVLKNNKRLNSIKNALFFHNTTIKPNWYFATPVKQIGNHIFYVAKTQNNAKRG